MNSTQHRVTLDEIPLTYVEAGEGDTILLVHGGGGPQSVATLLDHLSNDHRVIMPTTPGWNGTPRPHDLDDVRKLASVYLQLLRACGAQHTIAVGSSFGGWIAAETALQDTTDLVGGLVLIDAVGLKPETSHWPAPDPDSRFAAPSAAQSPLAFSLIEAYTGPAMWDSSLAGRLTALHLPSMVIWGEHDPVLNADYGRAYAAAIPGARFEPIEDAGHLPAVENPETTFKILADFLGSEHVVEALTHAE